MTRSNASHAASPRSRRDTVEMRPASSAAVRSPTKKPTCSASSPGSRSARRTSTTTAAFACRQVRRRRRWRSGSIAGCRFRSRTSRTPRPFSSPAPTSPRRCRRSCSTSRSPARPRRHGHRHRSAPDCDCRLGRSASAIRPGTDAALANGLLHVLIRDGLIDESYHSRSHRRVRTGSPASPRSTGPRRSSG